MREIDPQSEARLTDGLRRLAAESPRSAPAEMGAELLGKFRRHHARRRLMRRGGTLALIGLVAFAVWMWRSPAQRHSGQDNYAKTPSGTTQEKPTVSPAPVVAHGQPQQPKALTPPRSLRAAASVANRAFLALPAYDPSMPKDDLQVVRVQLPASALWKIGAPVPADAGERRVMADFVVGQDGTAYAVRLVQ
ncbi:MAG TPA: hypothetical protein VFR84_14980 [Candidatus Angelobacter sp.]|nr:hypothetical protein [Candidatus Angelobacter sp.]